MYTKVIGWLRLGCILLDVRPVAAQMWFGPGGNTCIYKLVHEPEFADFQVDTLVPMRVFERVPGVDFLARQ